MLPIRLRVLLLDTGRVSIVFRLPLAFVENEAARAAACASIVLEYGALPRRPFGWLQSIGLAFGMCIICSASLAAL